MLFTDLGLSEPILRAIAEEGYTNPTPIQEKSIPAVLKGGDLLAAAQTGTGKTAGFTLPILQRLTSSPKTGTGKRQLHFRFDHREGRHRRTHASQSRRKR